MNEQCRSHLIFLRLIIFGEAKHTTAPALAFVVNGTTSQFRLGFSPRTVHRLSEICREEDISSKYFSALKCSAAAHQPQSEHLLPGNTENASLVGWKGILQNLDASFHFNQTSSGLVTSERQLRRLRTPGGSNFASETTLRVDDGTTACSTSVACSL